MDWGDLTICARWRWVFFALSFAFCSLSLHFIANRIYSIVKKGKKNEKTREIKNACNEKRKKNGKMPAYGSHCIWIYLSIVELWLAITKFLAQNLCDSVCLPKWHTYITVDVASDVHKKSWNFILCALWLSGAVTKQLHTLFLKTMKNHVPFALNSSPFPPTSFHHLLQTSKHWPVASNQVY